MNKFFISILIFLAIFSACKEPEQYPIIPDIKFKEYYLTDTIDNADNIVKRLTIVFSVIDGDGDIGLDTSDTKPPYDTTSIYYNNLFITMFEKINGVFDTVDLKVPLRFRIPYVVQDGTLKADIKVDLDYYYPLKYDTVKYDFYIYDRALHQSNTETTSVIVFKSNP